MYLLATAGLRPRVVFSSTFCCKARTSSRNGGLFLVPSKVPKMTNKTSKIFSLARGTGKLADYSACDSPIEDIFYREIQKHLAAACTIHRQYECETHSKVYRLDFLVAAKHARIGFECNGKEHHVRPSLDRARDREILQAGHASKIYRLTGYDLVYHIHDLLQLIQKSEPQLFSRRGLINIRRLATESVLRRDEELGSDFPSGPMVIRRYFKRDEESPTEIRESASRPTVLRWTERGG